MTLSWVWFEKSHPSTQVDCQSCLGPGIGSTQAHMCTFRSQWVKDKPEIQSAETMINTTVEYKRIRIAFANLVAPKGSVTLLLMTDFGTIFHMFTKCNKKFDGLMKDAFYSQASTQLKCKN